VGCDRSGASICTSASSIGAISALNGNGPGRPLSSDLSWTAAAVAVADAGAGAGAPTKLGGVDASTAPATPGAVAVVDFCVASERDEPMLATIRIEGEREHEPMLHLIPALLTRSFLPCLPRGSFGVTGLLAVATRI